MELYFEEWNKKPLNDAIRHKLSSRRSKLQGTLAACVNITAERKAAQYVARLKVDHAVALLRFLSPVNQAVGMQSYCLPLGREKIEISTELFVTENKMRYNETVLERGPIGWDIDADRTQFPDLLSLLHNLASNSGTEFRQLLYDALLLYSRSSVVADVADKLVFILVSLESMLLKDSNEPIAKNIGERMAFLIGESVEERKKIVKNVDQTYRIRSEFIHHGDSPADLETVAEFFRNAGACFFTLLHSMNCGSTKADLIDYLEERKLS